MWSYFSVSTICWNRHDTYVYASHHIDTHARTLTHTLSHVDTRTHTSLRGLKGVPGLRIEGRNGNCNGTLLVVVVSNGDGYKRGDR